MSKTNKTKSPVKQITETAQQAGLVLMAAAVTLGMVELSNHPNGKIVLPNQPALEMVSDTPNHNDPIRREREETHPHYVSYSAYQRTPGRTGRA
jgi:hypothetical protein